MNSLSGILERVSGSRLARRAADAVFAHYARRRGARLDRRSADRSQEQSLLRLVRQAADTRFGRDHGFASIRTVADYQRRVPLRAYEDFWREYWEAQFPRLENCSWPGLIRYYADTSGTTSGLRKHIPVSRAILASNTRAVFDLFVHHIAHHPASRILSGKNFMLGGSTDLIEAAPGIYHGDLSGIAANEVPQWARRFAFPPPELAREHDCEKKTGRLAELSLHEDIRSFGGTPSWVLLFVEKLFALRPGSRTLADVYPHLELLVHGGVDFRPYRPVFERLLEGSLAE